GATYDLDTPSAQTSGIKIQVHAQLQPNLKYKIVLNFDPDKSIVMTGNGKYKLTPVINATVVQL
ncbi:MAG: carbohydrate-binding protein, partial [Marinilabiliales bacterium]